MDGPSVREERVLLSPARYGAGEPVPARRPLRGPAGEVRSLGDGGDPLLDPGRDLLARGEAGLDQVLDARGHELGLREAGLALLLDVAAEGLQVALDPATAGLELALEARAGLAD